jgi:energy-coupling factor transporter ATP-binding protein EcfA2
MSVWDAYPANYRHNEIETIRKAALAGECVSVVGLSGAGKSNLLGFLAHRVPDPPRFLLVDCNSLPADHFQALANSIVEALGGSDLAAPTLRRLIKLVNETLPACPGGICLLLDRFDIFNSTGDANRILAGNLRALRDEFKYQLTYVLSTRQPLAANTEFAELFCGHTLWLGPLDHEDADWSIRHYASRRGLTLTQEAIEKIIGLSWGYPSLVRGVCEAYADGVPLEISTLAGAVPIKNRVDEFWMDAPSLESLQLSGIKDQPLLGKEPAAQLDDSIFTAAEERLFNYFKAHAEQVCSKEDLINAAWPEEKIAAGLRDDSLTQLVHRLREKIDTPSKKHILTLPGRGYHYQA